MQIDVVTLFPELFTTFLQTSLVGRATAEGALARGSEARGSSASGAISKSTTRRTAVARGW